MTALTVQLPDDMAKCLKALVSSHGISPGTLPEEMSVAMLAAHDTEACFKAMAATGDGDAALEVLAPLGRNPLY